MLWLAGPGNINARQGSQVKSKPLTLFSLSREWTKDRLFVVFCFFSALEDRVDLLFVTWLVGSSPLSLSVWLFCLRLCGSLCSLGIPVLIT